MMEHQEYQELLALHALDALEAPDARAVTEHLATCAGCSAELIELRDAAALLAHTAKPVEPGAHLREQILGRIRVATDESRRDSRTSAQVVRLPDRREDRAWTNLLRIAASIALIALLIGIVVLWRRDVRLQREIAELSRQLNTQQGELARNRETLAQGRDALQMLMSPGTKRMELSGTASARNARGTFVLDPRTGHGMLMTQGLPAPPPEMAYELWFIADGRPMPGKVFTVDAAGRAMITDQVPPEARDRAVYAITLEPKQGVTAPTGAIYLSSPSS
jgi:anti-sigma factor RsiW